MVSFTNKYAPLNQFDKFVPLRSTSKSLRPVPISKSVLLLGAFPEGHFDFHLIAIPQDGQSDSLADAGLAQQVSNQVVHGLDLVAVDGGDHIAAHRDGLPVDGCFIGAAYQAGLSSGAVFHTKTA